MIYLGVLDKDYKITVDIKSGNINGDSIVFASKDQNISNINVYFVKGGNSVDITGFTFIANIRKPDTLITPYELTVVNAEEGLGLMDLPLSLTFDIGTYNFEIEMKKNNEISHTNSYSYIVRDTLCGDLDDTIIEDEEYNLLLKLTDDVNELEQDIKSSEKQRVIDENQRKTSEKVRIANEEERQRNTIERLKRVDAAIAAGTNDLEVKEAREDLKGKTHESLKLRIESDFEGLKENQDMAYSTDKGYLVCKETKNGTVKDLKIIGKSLVNLWDINSVDDTPINVSIDSGYVKTIANGTFITPSAKRVNMIKPSTDYTVIFEISKNTCNGNVSLNIDYNNESCFDESKIIGSNTVGMFVYRMRSKRDLSNCKFSVRTQVQSGCTSGEFIYRCVVLEGDYTQNPPSYFEGIASVGNGTDEIEVSSMNSKINSDNFVNEYYISSTNAWETGSTANLGHKILERVGGNLRIKIISENIRGIRVHWFDKDKRFINSTVKDGNVNNIEIVSPQNAKYVSYHCPCDNYEIAKCNMYINSIVQNKLEDKKTILFKDTDGTWKPIKELRGLDTVCDTIEFHSDGKYYYHQRMATRTFKGSPDEGWQRYASLDTSNTQRYGISVTDGLLSSPGMCDKMEYVINGGQDNATCIYIHNSDGRIDVRKQKTDDRWSDLQTFKTWLQSNNVTVIYQLAEEKVFEVNPLFLEAFEGETMVSINSGVINAPMEFKSTSSLPNLVKLNENRISKLENDFYQYTVVQNRLTLTSRYNADRVDFKVDNTIGNPLRSAKVLDHDLFNLMKANIEVGKENYNRVEMEERIDFYVNEGIIDWDMWDELFETMELQHNPPVDLTPIEPITVEVNEEETPKKTRRGRKKK
ncbi:phage pre-neck appendage-like protein [[Clostridium] sordellii]|uniref:BppU family phage baseplate upper protein n=1 Tax=Paraclostridium sordellii TaxID=1505 RepID=UPI0005E0FFBC|nr:BppU family phage baseplate upper protein [Paeniclostridium sordellii]CEQ01743.1 phage pre-neck appendage-like protein [[Clostridium] sordellii] [Paeniclostridium sordellii]